jgi:intracellular multiplication protein IcmL
MSIIETPLLHQKRQFFLNACLIMSIIIMLTSGVIVYQLTHRHSPVFHAVYQDAQGWHDRILKDLPVPIVRREVILERAALAATSAFTFDAAHYQEQVNIVSQEFFNDNGGKAYLKALETSGVRKAVEQNGLLVSAVVQKPAVILRQGMLIGRYSWKVQVPIMVAYRSTSDVQQKQYIVNMLILFSDTRKMPKGIGIEQFTVTRA